MRRKIRSAKVAAAKIEAQNSRRKNRGANVAAAKIEPHYSSRKCQAAKFEPEKSQTEKIPGGKDQPEKYNRKPRNAKQNSENVGHDERN